MARRAHPTPRALPPRAPRGRDRGWGTSVLAALVLLFGALGCAELRPPPPPSEPPTLLVTDDATAGQDIDAAPVIARALAALGGDRARSARVRTEEIERHQFTAWQSRVPGSPPMEAARTRLVRSVNPALGEEVLVERHRPIYPYPFPVEFDVREDMGGGHGYLHGADNALDLLSLFLPGQARMMSDARVAMREKMAWASSPYEILLAASSGHAERVGEVDVVHFSRRETPMTARFDRATGRLLELRILEDDPLLGGDVEFRIAFEDWGDSGLGTVEPRRLVHSVDGIVTLVDEVVRRTPQGLVPSIPAGAPPAGSALGGWKRAHFMLEWMGYGFPQDDAGESPQVVLKEIAPGVHVVSGGFHNSLLVELDDQRLALIEAPFSSERVEAILAEAARRFPGKRIDAVVQSHWHHDHSAGLRAAIAHGLPIFAGSAGAGMAVRDAARPRTLIPDALALSPTLSHITVVDYEVVILGSRNRVVLTPTDSLHAQDMLFISIPEAKVLFVADEINPGLATPNFALRQILKVQVPFFLVKAGTYAQDIVPFLATHDIQLIVGGHGAEVGTPADVYTLAKYADLPRFEKMVREHAEVPWAGGCEPSWLEPVVVDPALAPPAGLHVLAHVAASGTQDYRCVAGATDGGPAAAWTFTGPEATLTDCHGNPAGRHVASAAGPTAPEWLAGDGSIAIAKKQASAPAPRREAVPWLLLQVTSASDGGALSGAQYVQRTATVGGLAPSTGCDNATVGAEVKVPYTAEYWFFGR